MRYDGGSRGEGGNLCSSLLCRGNIERKNKEVCVCPVKRLMESVVAAGTMAAVGHILFSTHVRCQF